MPGGKGSTVLYRPQSQWRIPVPAELAAQQFIGNDVQSRFHCACLGHYNADSLAKLLSTQGDYAKAESLYTRSLRIKEKALGDSHPLVATTLNNLGVLYYRLKKLDQALPLMNRAVHIPEGKCPKGHPNLDTYRANYQFVLQAQEQLA